MCKYTARRAKYKEKSFFFIVESQSVFLGIANPTYLLFLKCEYETQSVWSRGLCLNVASMQLNCVLHDGKPKSCTSACATSSLIHSVEALKDARQMLVSDALSVVAESELPIIAIIFSTQSDASPFSCM